MVRIARLQVLLPKCESDWIDATNPDRSPSDERTPAPCGKAEWFRSLGATDCAARHVLLFDPIARGDGGGLRAWQDTVRRAMPIPDRPLRGIGGLFCVGAAGSLSADIHFGDVVVGDRTIEHDYKIRFDPADPPCHPANEQLLREFRKAAKNTLPFQTHFGSIASGDEDIVDTVRAGELRQLTGAKCVAWEGSGGARAAAFNGIPFLEIRAITDNADAHAATSFRANCEHAIPNIADLIVRWRLE